MTTDRRIPDDGASTLAAPMTEQSTVAHVTGSQWTTDPTQYPLQLDIGGERVVATGVAASGISPPGSYAAGAWAVTDGKIIQPSGGQIVTAGLNGGVHIGTGVSFGVAADVSIGWAYDGYPGVSFKRYSDVWTTAPQLVNGAEIFPGGTISPGKYWNHAAIDDTSNPLGGTTVVTLPDRVYALTGVRSTEATTFGIPQPTDHWHAGIFRINCHLVNGPNTWGSAPTLTAADTVPQYVARAQELVARGLVVSIEDHDLTGLDIEVPAALVSNPSLALGSIPAGPHQDACRLYDALAAAFPGATHNVWIGLPNEAWTSGRNTNLTNNATLTQRYDDFVVTYVRRIRAAGFTGIITIPTGRWAGELGPLSRGDYDSLITTLAGHGVAYNLVWEWHMYGSDYPAGVGGAAVPYTYSAADEQLADCRSKGIAVWMSEVGRPTPTPTPAETIEYRTVAAVDIMLTDTYGQALAVKYRELCATWWSTADNTFDVSYALTYGAANKGNDAGPDPNSTGPNAGVFPWWKITSAAAADEWLTYGGRAFWNTAHLLAEPAWQTFPVVRSVNRVRKSHATGTRVRVARPVRLSMAHASRAGAAGQTPELPPAPPPAPGASVTIPPFNLAGATNVSPGTNLATLVAADPAGTHYRLLPGAHNINNVRLKAGMHVRFDPGASATSGAGVVYAFRPVDANAHDVAIGGDLTGARPRILGYGNGTKNQDYAAIMGTPDDRVGGTYTYNDVTGWTVYHLDIENNSAGGIKLGSNWGVTDCWIHGHLVTGISGDRHVGGVIADNVLWWNALDPATGAQENGAQIKLTWTSGNVGRTAITPVDRARATTYIARNTFEARDRGSGSGDCDYAVWLDLDCWGVIVEHNTMTDHPGFGVFAEGCNNIEVRYNTVVNSDGYGAGLNSDFANAAICFGETTNSWAHHNTLIGCNFALMNRLSRRTFDWLNPASSTNYAHSTGSQYWISASEAIPSVDGQSNIWTGNNRFTDNVLIGCGRVVINEGTNGSTGGVFQTVHGKTPMATIEFARNNYTDSPGIIFDDRGTTMSLAGWQALGRQ